ncbi:MAG: SDR family NAD(P)-dependent oxidoreductase, partial [Myxococcota bacterium]
AAGDAGRWDRLDPWSGTGVFDSVAAGRIAYALGLAGPALAVHTACSASLVAIHLAVRALRSGECDLALAGGVNLLLAPEPTAYFAALGALSATGRCRTFDAAADGYVRGEGVGLLALKRLDDALAADDPVVAVILGTAVNQDGRTTALTAPSGRAQQAVIREALADARVDPAAIGFVEAHGTGTPLGDPIELAALGEVFRGDGRPVYVSSGKTQHGHLEAAAGVAGVIRAIGAIRSATIPPHLHLDALNPRIHLGGTRLRIARDGAGWDDGPRLAGVSAFGLSGTNAHLVLGPPPDRGDDGSIGIDRPVLVAVSGPTEAIVAARWDQVVAAVASGVPVPSAARAAADGRAVHRHRLAGVVGAGAEVSAVDADAVARGAAGKAPSLGFAFSGQGAQYAGMGRALYAAEPVYRDAVDAVDAAYRGLTGASLLPVLHGAGLHRPADGAIDHTRLTQPALFAVEWGLAALLRSWGIVPDVVLGHSIGELVAAAVAEVAPLSAMVELVVTRAEALARQPSGGSMVAVHAPAAVVEAAIARLGASASRVGIAAYNGPEDVVVSGEADAVDAVVRALPPDLRAVRLSVSHPFHSAVVAAAGAEVGAAVVRLGLGAPRIPLYSAVSGQLADDDALATAAFWSDHLAAPVRWASAVGAAVDDGTTLFVEIGPRRVLGPLGPRIAPGSTWLGGLHPDRDDRAELLGLVGGLFVRGIRPAFRTLFAGIPRGPTPVYPFARDRYWIDPGSVEGARSTAVQRYRLVPTSTPRPSAPTGAWSAADPALAEALVAAGATVAPDAPQVVVRVDKPADLAAVAAACRRDGVERLWLVAGSAGADLARGLAAGAATELPSTFGGLVIADDPADAVAGLGATDGEDAATIDATGRTVDRLVPVAGSLAEPPPLDPRPVVVTGGTGAFGLAIAGWLADLGARHLVLASRSAVPADPAAVAALRARGVAVDLAAVDVTDPAAVRALLAPLDLQGVVHAAGLAGATPLSDLAPADLARVVGPKLDGARNLDAALGDRGFLLIVASIAGIWGSPGLAAYGAASRATHGVIRARRGRGQAGAVVAFGPLAVPGGMVTDAERAAFARVGVHPIPVDAALAVLGAALRGATGPAGDGEWIAADVDWARLGPALTLRRPRPLLDRVRVEPADRDRAPSEALGPSAPLDRRSAAALVAAEVARVLGRPGVALDPAVGLFELGLDSAMAVELAARLRAATGAPLSVTIAFDHPTIAALTAKIVGELPAAPSARPDPTDEPIAIIGFSGRFPGAADPEALWELLVAGVDAVGEVPPDRWVDPPAIRAEAIRAGGYLDDVASFEPSFFGIGPGEARVLDPQQRLLLEVGWEALERSGTAPDRLEGSRTGVYVGVSRSEYADRLRDPELDGYPWSGTGSATSFVAGRVAHVLGLRGPAVGVDTACSSSLVAVHLACRALRDGEVDTALAGGVNVLLSAESTVYLARIGALSPTGRCRPFSAAADGYVRAEGCGVVVLKRLSDARRDGDRVWATIRGSAIGHDGRSGGLTVPTGAAQREVIERALASAGVAPAEVAVLEAHGTGTPLGDAIELGAIGELGAALGPGRTAPLVVTAVKSNLGHLESAAGIVGLIKLVLALDRGIVPGTLHLDAANPATPDGLAVTIPRTATPWPSTSRIAGLSSFGISGTTAHLVIEGPEPALAPADADPGPPVVGSGPHLVAVSAHTEAALAEIVAGLAPAADRFGVAAVASTMAHGRAARRHRLAVVAPSDDPDLLRGALRDALRGGQASTLGTAVDGAPDVGFAFGPGDVTAGIAAARALIALGVAP